jgi:hypothetical protein
MPTRAAFAAAVCQAGGFTAAGAPAAFVACMYGESSQARFNPMDTTEPWAGSTMYNSVGVRNYATWGDGVSATVATLRNGFYPRLLPLLLTPLASAAAIVGCPDWRTWGTWGSPAEALADLAYVQAHWQQVSGATVAGSDEPSPPQAAPIPKGGGRMAFLAQQPGEPGVWVVRDDLTAKHPLADPQSELALLALGYQKTTQLTAAELATIPTQ